MLILTLPIRHFVQLRQRISDLVNLISVQVVGRNNSILRWDAAIERKIRSDYRTLFGRGSTYESRRRRSAVRAAWDTLGAAFTLDVNEMEVQRNRLQTLASHMMDMEHLLNADPASQGARDAIARAHRRSPMRRIAPAAIRELARLDRQPRTAAAAAGNVARRWLELICYHPDLQDPLLGVRRAQRRLNHVTRRSDLLTEVRSMLQNEGFNRRQRALDRAAGVQGVVGDPTVDQLRGAIRAMASQGDETFLMNHFTDERIQRGMDGNHDLTAPELEPVAWPTMERNLAQLAEGFYRTLGL